MDLYIIITDYCNLKCSFCIRNNLSTVTKGEFSIVSFVTAIDLLRKNFNIKTIILTGGEPTLHGHLYTLIRLCLNRHLRVIITSNGTFDKNIIKEISCYFGQGLFLQISLDGTKSVHDKIRGEVVFERILQNLTLLEMYHEYISISTTVEKNTMRNVLLLAEVLNTLHFHHWKVSQAQQCKPTKANIIPSFEWNEFVLQLLSKCKFRVHIKKLFDFAMWDKALASCDIDYNCLVNNCGIGRTKLYIDSNCNVIPCTCMPDTIGNLLIDDIAAIKAKLDSIAHIKPSDSSQCNKCKYVKICNGGCPGYSWKCFGKLNMGDIRCPMIEL